MERQRITNVQTVEKIIFREETFIATIKNRVVEAAFIYICYLLHDCEDRQHCVLSKTSFEDHLKERVTVFIMLGLDSSLQGTNFLLSLHVFIVCIR
jgi:hypothetical protein